MEPRWSGEPRYQGQKILHRCEPSIVRRYSVIDEEKQEKQRRQERVVADMVRLLTAEYALWSRFINHRHHIIVMEVDDEQGGVAGTVVLPNFTRLTMALDKCLKTNNLSPADQKLVFADVADALTCNSFDENELRSQVVAKLVAAPIQRVVPVVEAFLLQPYQRRWISNQDFLTLLSKAAEAKCLALMAPLYSAIRGRFRFKEVRETRRFAMLAFVANAPEELLCAESVVLREILYLWWPADELPSEFDSHPRLKQMLQVGKEKTLQVMRAVLVK